MKATVTILTNELTTVYLTEATSEQAAVIGCIADFLESRKLRIQIPNFAVRVALGHNAPAGAQVERKEPVKP